MIVTEASDAEHEQGLVLHQTPTTEVVPNNFDSRSLQERTGNVSDVQVYLLEFLSLKVTSIQFCAMRYVSCNSCCCAVQPVTFTKEVAFLVLASVVEFRSTISEIDKSHDSFSHSAPHGV